MTNSGTDICHTKSEVAVLILPSVFLITCYVLCGYKEDSELHISIFLLEI